MDSYDNDFLFIDDDLFLFIFPYYEVDNDPMFKMIFWVDSTDDVEEI